MKCTDRLEKFRKYQKIKIGDKRGMINQKVFGKTSKMNFLLKNRYILNQWNHTTEVSRKQLFKIFFLKMKSLKRKYVYNNQCMTSMMVHWRMLSKMHFYHSVRIAAGQINWIRLLHVFNDYFRGMCNCRCHAELYLNLNSF